MVSSPRTIKLQYKQLPHNKKNEAVTAEALSWLKLLNTILLNWFLLTWLLVEEEYVNKIAIKRFRERYQLTLRVASCQLFKNSKYWH